MDYGFSEVFYDEERDRYGATDRHGKFVGWFLLESEAVEYVKYH